MSALGTSGELRGGTGRSFSYFDDCTDGVILVTAAGRAVAANPAACELLQMSEEEIRAAGPAGVIDPPDRPGVQAALSAPTPPSGRLEATLRRGDGSAFVGALSIARGPDGGRWLSVRDVTGRRRREQALENLAELTSHLLGGAPVAELMTRTAAAARRMLGAAAAWISATSEGDDTIVVVAQDSDSPDVPDYRGRRFPRESVLAGMVASSPGPVLIEDMSAEASGASDMGRSLGFGPALGVPLGHGEHHFGSLIVACRHGSAPYSETDLATAELLARSAAVDLGLAAVQADLANLAALYDESPDAVLLTNSSGVLLSANRAAQEMFDMSEDELRASGPPPEVDGLPAGRPAPDAIRREFTHRRRDGTLVIGDVASVSASGPLGEVHRWTVVRDVTERRRTEERLRGLSELTMALLGREPLDQILTRCAGHARRLVNAVAAYAVTLSEGGREVVVTAEDAPDPYSLLGLELPPGSTLLGRAITAGESMVVADLGSEPGVVEMGLSPGLGPALIVPLLHQRRSFGALVAVAERGGPRYDSSDLAVVEMFAGSAALAMDLSSTRGALAIVEERERIANDLHDRVIQHLFGTGLGLQAVIGRSPEEMDRAVTRAVGALDRIISEIRGTIFDLGGV